MPSFGDYHIDGRRHSLRNLNDELVIRCVDRINRGRIDSGEPNSGTFSDLPFYLDLLHNPDYSRVDLAGVIVHHNSFVLGIQSVYRCTKKTKNDGGAATTAEYEFGPFHLFNTGPYGDTPEEVHVRKFALRPGEDIENVECRQGIITDAIVFRTNYRLRGSVWFGGQGGDHRSTCLSLSDPSRNGRIVALAGTRKGVIHRVGFCTCLDTKASLVRHRRLCEQGRATPMRTAESPFDWMARTLFGYVRPRVRSDRAVQALAAYPSPDEDEEGVPDDIFEQVLGYL